jgi:hypothetical protein
MLLIYDLDIIDLIDAIICDILLLDILKYACIILVYRY